MKNLLQKIEQTALPARWGVSLSTVKRIVKACPHVEPVDYRGLQPVFTAAQADGMIECFRRLKVARLAAMSRPVRRTRGAQQILTVVQARRKAGAR